MKEKFLNLFLFLFSFVFLGLGVVLMFFHKVPYFDIITTNGLAFFKDAKLTEFFISFLGTFVFTWGVFFFLMTVFTVMEMKHTNVYGFIFWIFTFWIGLAEFIAFMHTFFPFMIGLGILYGVIFIPFFFALPMKSGK